MSDPAIFHRLDPRARDVVFCAVQDAITRGFSSIGVLSLARGLAAARRGTCQPFPAGAQRELPLGQDARSVLLQAARLAQAESNSSITEPHLAEALRNTGDPDVVTLLSTPEAMGQSHSHEPIPRLRVPLIVLGLGGVGQSLIQQILANRNLHLRAYGLWFELRGAADSSGHLTAPPGEPDVAVQALIDYKAGGHRLSERPDFTKTTPEEQISEWTERPGLIADCTAADTVPFLLPALKRGWRVALANKKPLTQSFSVFEAFTGLARWEATVGAGLPVTTSLRRLAAAGDRVVSVSGSVSSTLGYLMSGLAEGKLLSRLVAEVARQGYTEPDPREDLSGRDVARKALILARTLGWPLEPADVRVEGLLPPEFDGMPLGDFWANLTKLDDSFQQSAAEAGAREETLRYGFRLDSSGARVGRLSVPRDSPLGRLTGTNQLVEIHSYYYSNTPLVIQGRGIGVQATAAGVLADLVELAQQMAQA